MSTFSFSCEILLEVYKYEGKQTIVHQSYSEQRIINMANSSQVSRSRLSLKRKHVMESADTSTENKKEDDVKNHVKDESCSLDVKMDANTSKETDSDPIHVVRLTNRDIQ